MPAYFLVDVLEITDEAKMEEYRAGVFGTVEQYGGSYRVLGGPFEVVEGFWTPTFPVLIEFPTLEKAKAWYNSDEYRPLRKLRGEGTKSNGVFLPGLTEDEAPNIP